jgi:hypothetical protein
VVVGHSLGGGAILAVGGGARLQWEGGCCDPNALGLVGLTCVEGKGGGGMGEFSNALIALTLSPRVCVWSVVAGTAAVVALMLREEFPDVRAFSFNGPPVFSRGLAQRCLGFVHSVTNGGCRALLCPECVSLQLFAKALCACRACPTVAHALQATT